MTKQEQIEEMAQIICGRCEDGVCLIDKSLCHGLCEELKAEALYNANYRKVPENAVVITREDYERLKNNYDRGYYFGKMDGLTADKV